MTTEEFVFSQSNLDNLTRMWAEAPTTFPVAGSDWPVDEPNDDESTREPSDHDYDVLADRYERNWV